MTEQNDITEADLRRKRDEVDRLYAEALARLREASAANREYRAAVLAAYPMEIKNDSKET